MDQRKRLVFVSQNIDTAKGDRWRYRIPILGLMDELRALVGNANSRAAHKDMHAQCLKWGSRTFGYRGLPIPGPAHEEGQAERAVSGR